MEKCGNGLLPHIPRMRRLARIMVSDSEFADDLVAAALAKAVATLRLNPDYQGDVRVLLFGCLHDVSFELNDPAPDRPEPSGAGDPSSLAAHLELLTPLERLSLGLVVTEALSYEAAAGILGIGVDDVRLTVSRARATLLLAQKPATKETYAPPMLVANAAVVGG
ncbi:MAG: hypothetical protein R3322_20140 [Kiloniellales bacterium]|jgi:DNA-directed RNA polymerase specialized sigma24 family protein|nr:hypothetical protein [Kiloniellales bacterium]